mmetsp:Transcript_27196/g.41741  ORF Transcript_27196/g.41741 Transcript_27196/m.41741 type:complete len:248 (-) Transcript_27196:142-885(-)
MKLSGVVAFILSLLSFWNVGTVLGQEEEEEEECRRRLFIFPSELYCWNAESIEVLASSALSYNVSKGAANQRLRLPAETRKIEWICGRRTHKSYWIFPANTVDVTFNPVTERVRFEAFLCGSDGYPTLPPTMMPTEESCSLQSGDMIPRGSFLVCGNEEFGISGESGQILYLKDRIVLWSAGVADVDELRMQAGDGNLVGYTAANVPVWASSNSGLPVVPGSSLYIGDGMPPRVVSPAGETIWEAAI